MSGLITRHPIRPSSCTSCTNIAVVVVRADNGPARTGELRTRSHTAGRLDHLDVCAGQATDRPTQVEVLIDQPAQPLRLPVDQHVTRFLGEPGKLLHRMDHRRLPLVVPARRLL